MEPWRTAIANSDEANIWIRGYDIGSLMQRASFADLLFLLHRSRLPTPSERRLLDAILIAVADHGAGAPSCAAARLAASGNRQSLSAAEANSKLAVAGGTTDPTLSTEYDRNGIDNSFGVSLAIPLRIFDRNQGEKERTRYEVDSSRTAVTAVRNQVVSDVDLAWMALETAQRMAQRYNGHYIDEAGHVRDNLQFSYRNGNTTLLDYLSALRDYRAVRLSSLSANAQVWLALHQLSFATATDILP